MTALHVFGARIDCNDIDRLDITRSGDDSIGRIFAPSYDILGDALIARDQASELRRDANDLTIAPTGIERLAYFAQAEQIESAAWAIYEPLYIAEMRVSYRQNRREWDKVLARKRCAVCCFCVLKPDAPQRCHRVILRSFIADPRTRAPAAYANVIALCEENERLRLISESWQAIAEIREGTIASKDLDIAELLRVVADFRAEMARDVGVYRDASFKTSHALAADLVEERARVASLIDKIWTAAKRAGIANDVPPDGPNAIQFCRLLGDEIERRRDNERRWTEIRAELDDTIEQLTREKP